MEPFTVIEDLLQGVHKVYIGALLLPQPYRIDLLAERVHQRFRLFQCQDLRRLAQKFVMLREVAAQFRHVILGWWLPLQGIVFTNHR